MATPVASGASTLDSAVVRLRDPAGRIVGAGFLVGSGEVVTCAHVVTRALGPSADNASPLNAEIQLDFPLVEARQTYVARIVAWQPAGADNTGDVAVLQIATPPTAGAKAARLLTTSDLWGHPFRAFGFPMGHDDGVWVSGVLRSRQATGWVQIEDVNSTAFRVGLGFSGTPVWDDELGGVVGMVVASESRLELRAAYMITTEELIRTWPSLADQAFPPSPYRGLQPFREEDASLFFGREELSNRLVDEISRRSLVAVVGPSGSGKSSLVFAGAIPKIRRHRSWAVATLRPGKAISPALALAAALLPLLEPTMTETQRLHEMSQLADVLLDHRLPEVVDRALERAGAQRLLLVVDQFEELYAQEPTIAKKFIDLLLDALPTTEGPRVGLTLAITLRADFLGQALEHPRLAEALQGGVLVIGTMTREQLRLAIDGPVVEDVTFEAGLVDRILDDVGGEPGNLPLLQFTLLLLWEHAAGWTVSHEVYEKLGGVDGALARYAEEVYLRELQTPDQVLARRLFVQLVRPGESTEHMRRVAHRGDLDERRWLIAQRLATTRLVVTGRDATGVDTVEVVHEALISKWDRLRHWIEDDHDFRLWQERLRGLIEQWERANREQDALLRGIPLAEAEGWVRQRQEDLSSAEQHYIEASKAAHEGELRTARRRNLRLQILVVALATLLAVATISVAVARRQTNRAEERQRIATSRQLALDALSRLDRQPALGLLLSLRALRVANTFEARSSLLESLQRDPRLAGFVPITGGSIAPAFSPDGAVLAAASKESAIVLWDVKHQRLIAKLGAPGTGIGGVAFSPDGRIVASADFKGLISIWDVEQRTLLRALHAGDTQGAFPALTFSPNGRILATVAANDKILLWDVRTWKRLQPQPLRNRAQIYDLEFSPDGSILASAGYYSVVLWDVERGKRLGAPISFDGPVESVAFSPDGEILAAGGEFEGTVELWNIRPRRHLRTLFSGQPRNFPSVSFSSDGRTLAASTDKGVIVWDVRRNKAIGAPLVGTEQQAPSVKFARDGRTLAAASSDGIVLWDIRQKWSLGVQLTTKWAHSLAFSQDRGTLAVGGDDEATIWDPRVQRPLGRIAVRAASRKGEKDHEGVVVTSVSLTRDGSIVSIGSGHSVALLNVEREWVLGKPLIGDFRGGWSPGEWNAALSPDGRTLAFLKNPEFASPQETGGAQVVFWDVQDRKEIGSVNMGHNSAYRLVFSHDGKRLALPAGDRLTILDVNQRKVLTELRVNARSAAFSPDDRILAVANDEGVTLWDLRRQAALGKPLTGQDGVPYSLAFSGDGQILATGSEANDVDVIPGSIVFWDVGTHQRLGRPMAAPAESIAVSPEGMSLAAGGIGGVVLFEMDIASWRARACRIVGPLSHTDSEAFSTGPEYRDLCK